MDITKFLTEDLGFSAEDAAALAPKFGTTHIEKVKARLGDAASLAASRTEIQQTQTALKQANDRLNAEMVEWANMTKREQAEATELRSSLEAARVRSTQLETRLTTLAQQHGVDPKTLLEGTAAVPEVKKKDEPAAVDERLAASMSYNFDLPATLQYIADEHRELTGQRYDTRPLMKRIRENASKGGEIDPVKVWETMENVSTKRAEKATQAEAASKKKYDDDMRAAEERGAERVRSEASLPTTPQPGRRAPVFGRTDNGQFAARKSALSRPQPGTAHNTAVQSLRSGKYRQQSSTTH